MLSNCDLVSNVSPLLIFCRYQMKCKSVSNVSPRYIDASYKYINAGKVSISKNHYAGDEHTAYDADTKAASNDFMLGITYAF